MLIATRSPLPVGLIPWAGRPDVWTVVVKRTFDIVQRGTAMPSSTQTPLSLDVAGPGGTLISPTDFAPAKLHCDVVLVGGALLDSEGPARLAVEPIRKLVELPRQLGPTTGVGPAGDPTDPSVHAAWESADFDFEAFQCAPRDQRAPLSPFPLDLMVDIGAARVVTRLDAPPPEGLLLDLERWLAPRAFALRADTIAIDPLALRLTVTFRGLVELPGGIDPLLVIGVGPPLRESTPRDMERWPRVDAVEPALLRRLSSFRVTRELGADDYDEEESWGTTAQLEASGSAPTDRPPPPLSGGGLLPAPEEGATEISPALGPKIAAPERAPSFGAPPSRKPELAPAQPVAALPRPMLGGLMMLPLETRKGVAPSTAPPAPARPAEVTAAPPRQAAPPGADGGTEGGDDDAFVPTQRS